MAANITDKFTEATNGTRPDNAALTAQKSIGAASITVDSTAGWGTATAVHFVIYQVNASGTRVANTQTEWKGIVSSPTSITSLTLKAGSDQVYPVGSKVIATPTAAAWDDAIEGILDFANQDGTLITSAVRAALGLTSGETSGWETLGYAPNTITALGNRSYTVIVNSVDLTPTTSVGMRFKLPRTVTAPTQCTDLESGSSQYFSKTSPTGVSFTTAFTCSAWIKLESYGAVQGIIARRNADVEGWHLRINASGQVDAAGLRIASNNKSIISYQSVPLNKWVHVAVTMDMSAGDTSAQKIWIDGVEVPRSYVLTGTATALVQGTSALTVGADRSAGSNPFDGKIAQAAVFGAQLSDATIKAMANQTMTGSETNLVSAFTLNNSLNDLSANANNLTANGGALATDTDTPFTNPVTGTSVVAGTTNYGIIMAQTFSTNTTYTIQIPEGETLPTTGGIGTVSYSTQAVPYSFPRDAGKWEIITNIRSQTVASGVSTGNFTYHASQGELTVPIGAWQILAVNPLWAESGSSTDVAAYTTYSTSSSTVVIGSEEDIAMTQRIDTISINHAALATNLREKYINTSTSVTYYCLVGRSSANVSLIWWDNDNQPNYIKARCAYL